MTSRDRLSKPQTEEDPRQNRGPGSYALGAHGVWNSGWEGRLAQSESSSVQPHQAVCRQGRSVPGLCLCLGVPRRERGLRRCSWNWGWALRQGRTVPRATCPSRRSPPSLQSAPCAPSTFCELKDWVQWYRTRLSLGQWAGLAASGASGASTGLAASLSSAEMGHQLQLVGVRLLGVAMTARDRRRKEAARRRLAGAQHHMASPSLPLSLLPLPAMSLLTGCRGRGKGIPRLFPPPLSCRSSPRAPGSEGCWKQRRVGRAPRVLSWAVTCQRPHHHNTFVPLNLTKAPLSLDKWQYRGPFNPFHK